jgi:hypothetical protein
LIFHRKVAGEDVWRVMKAGGNSYDSSTGSPKVFLLDPMQQQLSWVPGPDMLERRVDFNLIALPDGRIAAMGGQKDFQSNCPTDQFHLKPAIYDPASNSWITPDACMVLARTHHSSEVLLPSGAVFIAGGDGCLIPACDNSRNHSYEIYKPSYFFQGTRPSICAGPQRIHYGTTFTASLASGEAADITKVRLIRPGASTHSYDQSQRSMELASSVPGGSDNTLCITAPLNGYEAPPGYYMLFVAKGINGALPSTAHWVQLVPAGSGTATITGANPPTANPYCPGTPFRDVLQTGPSTGNTLTQGIGGTGTLAEGPYTYAPITVTFSGPLPEALSLTPDNITVNCTFVGKTPCSTTCPTVQSVSTSDEQTWQLTLTGPIPPGGRTELTFMTAAPGQVLSYDYLPADVKMDAVSTTDDLHALNQALSDGSANLPENLARYDIDRSGSANTRDYLRAAQLLNGTGTTQVWNGARVVQCGGDLSCGEGGGGAAPGGSGGDSAGPAGGEAGGSGSMTDAQLIAALQAACAEYDVDAAECQQMITNLFGPQP